MNTTTTMLRSAALAYALALTACGARADLDDEGPWNNTSASSSSSGSGGSGTSTSSTSSSSSSNGGSGGEGGEGGGGGSQPAFSAQCAGIVDCPSLDDCARWDYAVKDDGDFSHVTGTITILMPNELPPCSADATIDDLSNGGLPTDVVTVPCGAQEWSLGLDRSTLTVYVNLEPTGFSWTPPCH